MPNPGLAVAEQTNGPGEARLGRRGPPRTSGSALAYTNRAYDWGLSTGMHIRLGATWSFGGKLQGAGRLLHNAQLYGIIDDSPLGGNAEIAGHWGDPYLRGQTGVLPGIIEVHVTSFHITIENVRYEIEVSGDGAGHITRQ